jgi:hypothetical protein
MRAPPLRSGDPLRIGEPSRVPRRQCVLRRFCSGDECRRFPVAVSWPEGTRSPPLRRSEREVTTGLRGSRQCVLHRSIVETDCARMASSQNEVETTRAPPLCSGDLALRLLEFSLRLRRRCACLGRRSGGGAHLVRSPRSRIRWRSSAAIPCRSVIAAGIRSTNRRTRFASSRCPSLCNRSAIPSHPSTTA